jgi:hypothetical protein
LSDADRHDHSRFNRQGSPRGVGARLDDADTLTAGTHPLTAASKTSMALSSWLSRDVLERVTDWAELFAQIFGIAAVVSGAVYFVFNKPLSRLKDEENLHQRQTFERNIAESNTVAAKANERAENLELDSAKQRERAAKAEADLLQLRKQIAPRAINRDTFLAALNGQPKARVEVMYLKDDPDSWRVAELIWELLQEAKWEAGANPISMPPTSNDWPDLPTAVFFGGQPSGVTVVAHSAPGLGRYSPGRQWEHTPFTVLQDALFHSMGSVTASASNLNMPPEGTLRVVVAPRM